MAYSYYRTITVDKTKVGGATQTDFPVLVTGTYSWLATTANGGKVQNANGYDVAFFSNSGLTTQLKHEVQKYVAATGEVSYWVKVPSLSSTADTTFYIAYGDASITTSQADAPNVWTNGFQVVRHFEDGTTLNVDSATGTYPGTAYGSPTATTGRLGGGIALNGSSQWVRGGATASSSSSTGEHTMTAWINTPAPTGTVNQTIVGLFNSSNTFDMRRVFVAANTGLVTCQTNGGSSASLTGTTVLQANTWYHVAFLRSGQWNVVMVNGAVEVQAGYDVTLVANPDRWSVGCVDRQNSQSAFFNGVIDEARLSQVYRPSWVTAEYNNQNSPSTFYSVGAEQGGGGGSSVIVVLSSGHHLRSTNR